MITASTFPLQSKMRIRVESIPVTVEKPYVGKFPARNTLVVMSSKSVLPCRTLTASKDPVGDTRLTLKVKGGR